MKTLSFLFMLSVGSFLLGDLEPAMAKTIPTTSDLSNARSYQKITTMITTIEKEVKHDLVKLVGQMGEDEKTKTKYESMVKSYTASSTKFKKSLAQAKAAYASYNAQLLEKNQEDAELIKSLQRQQAFIKMERQYIDHMETESLHLKKYSRQYAVIRSEIRQMRVQVNKEIADVEAAYRRIRTKLSSQKASVSQLKTTESNKQVSYSQMVERYESLTVTYTKLLSKLHSGKVGNLKLKKELQDQLDLLQEIRVILATFKPGSDTNDKYQKKYEACVEDFRVFRNKYANMNCTAL